MNLTKLNIGLRLALAFAAVLALMVTMIAMGIGSMASIETALDKVVNVSNVKLDATTDMRDAQRRMAITMRNIVLDTGEAASAEQTRNLAQAKQDYASAAATLEKMITLDAGKAILNRISIPAAQALPLMETAADLGRANKTSEATEVIMKQIAPLVVQWQQALSDMLEHQAGQNKAAAELALQNYLFARQLMLGLGLLAMAFSALVAWRVSRSITQPLHEAVRYAEAIAAGDLSQEIVITTGDETGKLMTAMQQMNSALRTIVGKVRTGVESMASASGQIASGNLDLSSRTEQQASALEETASSMEEMTSTTRQNADNARQANVMAVSATQVANKGGEVVAQVVATMNDINDSSRKIVDIIAVIDGIAFQTNILALNAAVEAARAGEQGRGFAVVASEVRNLAQRSAAAAKEIKVLIGDSVGKVDFGSKLVDKAGQTMSDIVASVQSVSDIMGEIGAASQEQEAGIGQINQAVTEMDAVTQQNAALVEEAAAAAASLQEQAAALALVVSVFKLDALTAAHAEPAPVPRPAARAAPAPRMGATARSPAKPAALALDNGGWESF